MAPRFQTPRRTAPVSKSAALASAAQQLGSGAQPPATPAQTPLQGNQRRKVQLHATVKPAKKDEPRKRRRFQPPKKDKSLASPAEQTPRPAEPDEAEAAPADEAAVGALRDDIAARRAEASAGAVHAAEARLKALGG